jgi:AAA+ superfamily predicted ATPase
MSFAKLADDDGGDDDIETGRYSEYHLIANRGFSPATPPVVVKALSPGVYSIESIGFFTAFCPHEIKTDDLIRIPDGNVAEVLAEIDKFWGLKDSFKKFGFLHKRGFLLYGPPGTGKTTTLNHIMEDTVKEGGIVILAPPTAPGLLVDMLRDLRAVEADRQLVVVMEDLDNLIRFGETELLSLLDGEHAIENVVYIATTNYLERIPARIHDRPSRFDKKILIAGPNENVRKLYLESRGVDPAVIPQWVKASKGLSMAHLKELIISVAILGNDLLDTAKRLQGKEVFAKPEDDLS